MAFIEDKCLLLLLANGVARLDQMIVAQAFIHECPKFKHQPWPKERLTFCMCLSAAEGHRAGSCHGRAPSLQLLPAMDLSDPVPVAVELGQA